MRLVTAALASSIVLSAASSFAQDPSPSSSSSHSQSSSPSISVPRLINLNGVFRPADGQPVAGAETVTFAVYTDETGGTPIWQETQQVQPDASGRYTVLLGATQTDGVPLEVFASGEARWLGMIWTRGDGSQNKRSRLTFVPYAVHATDADTLGGKPASAYALTSVSDGTAAKTGTSSDPVNAHTVLAGTPGHLAVYAANGVDIMNATTVESGGRLGVGTPAPLDYVHAQFTDNTGGFTGFAVQNLSGGAAAYSGTLFYDNLGNLGQFQGFNNSTHEYRINNVAKNGPNFNGSINFMTGGTSRFFVSTGGNIGIGTTAPAFQVEATNALSTNATSIIASTSYGPVAGGSIFVGRKFRGTSGAPTAVLNNDQLVVLQGRGMGATGLGVTGGGAIAIRTTENWTDTAQGTAMGFYTTPNGTAAQVNQMTLDPFGQLGIGVVGPSSALEVARNGGGQIKMTTYGGPPEMILRKARGTQLAPTPVLNGSDLGDFAMSGYGATGFGDPRAGIGAVATEDWSDTAQGAALFLAATPNGTVNTSIYIAIQPDGKVGIDAPVDINGNPSPALDPLEVFGDVRVGTGTTGCVKDADATVIAGTCSSDLRLKKNITPFGPTLQALSTLRPVHYDWRADEFPDRHFGTKRTYGLIAQDVEQVLPELVTTDNEGYKAVNYSELPLLTIQAMKELKSENDVLKQQVAQDSSDIASLKQRMAELERVLTELKASVRR